MWLIIVVFVLFLVCVAFTWNEGAWNNILTFFMALFAGIIATNYYGWLAELLTYTFGTVKDYTRGGNYLWDIISFWLFFGIAFSLLRLVVDRLSKFKVKFKKPVEIAMNWLTAFAVGCLMVTLFLFTVHIAPLSRHPFGGVFQYSPTMRHMVIGPDRIWMNLADYWSSQPLGPLSTMLSADEFGSPQDFIDRHYWRRRTLEGEKGFWVDMETTPPEPPPEPTPPPDAFTPPPAGGGPPADNGGQPAGPGG